MAEIRKKTEIDRSFDGALKEIYRLCDKIKQLEQDNKFLSEQLMAVGKERNVLRHEVERLTEAAFDMEEHIKMLGGRPDLHKR